MASGAGVGRIVIIPVMASGTVIGNYCVCAVEPIILIVIVEARRHPPRLCAMAGSAIVGKAE